MKALAKCLEKTIPENIHFNQNVFLKGRTIFDAIKIIGDEIEYTKQKGLSRVLVAIDFEKAFDTLNFNYLISDLASSSGYACCIKMPRVVCRAMFFLG